MLQHVTSGDTSPPGNILHTYKKSSEAERVVIRQWLRETRSPRLEKKLIPKATPWWSTIAIFALWMAAIVIGVYLGL